MISISIFGYSGSCLSNLSSDPDFQVAKKFSAGTLLFQIPDKTDLLYELNCIYQSNFITSFFKIRLALVTLVGRGLRPLEQLMIRENTVHTIHNLWIFIMPQPRFYCMSLVGAGIGSNPFASIFAGTR